MSHPVCGAGKQPGTAHSAKDLDLHKKRAATFPTHAAQAALVVRQRGSPQGRDGVARSVVEP